MKKFKFTEAQIVFALQQAETGVAVAEVFSQVRDQRSHFLQVEEEVQRVGHCATVLFAPQRLSLGGPTARR